ncbi:MAG: hypothetical protein MUP63_02650 [Candidatus Nanohaloarchaeota archaeon QJJ-7]|nr:hypothetical protein [Candidatus Nanohaloarchaeota archaeon QJJ-7]
MPQTAETTQKFEGRITRVLNGSGAIERCPECNRVLVNDHCVVHLDVDPVEDLRVKAEISSGETLVFNGDFVQHILGISPGDAHALPEHDILNVVQEKFTGKEIEVTASQISDEDMWYVEEIHNMR